MNLIMTKMACSLNSLNVDALMRISFLIKTVESHEIGEIIDVCKNAKELW